MPSMDRAAGRIFFSTSYIFLIFSYQISLFPLFLLKNIPNFSRLRRVFSPFPIKIPYFSPAALYFPYFSFSFLILVNRDLQKNKLYSMQTVQLHKETTKPSQLAFSIFQQNTMSGQYMRAASSGRLKLPRL